MKRELLNEARSNPYKEILFNCDERLGDRCGFCWDDLIIIMAAYGITEAELYRYDIRDARELWTSWVTGAGFKNK